MAIMIDNALPNRQARNNTLSPDAATKLAFSDEEWKLIDAYRKAKNLTSTEFFETAIRTWSDSSNGAPRTYYLAPCRPTPKRSVRISARAMEIAETVKLCCENGHRVTNQKSPTLVSAVFWFLGSASRSPVKFASKIDASRPRMPVTLID